MMVRCIYASRATSALVPAAVESILVQSRTNNPRNGITGILCYSDDTFIQVLEGGRDAVCELYNTIVRDARHTQVRLLVFEEIEERKFCNWSMGHVDLQMVNPGLLLKYHERAVLNPFACSGRTTASLLDELVDTAAIATHVT